MTGDSQAVPALVQIFNNKKTDGEKEEAAEALMQIVRRNPDPVVRVALPALHRLRKRNRIFQEALEQIEAATATSKDLPLPAAAPPPDARLLDTLAPVAETTLMSLGLRGF